MNLKISELKEKAKQVFKDKTEQDQLIDELLNGDKQNLKLAEQQLLEKDLEYRERTGHKYITMIIGIFILAPLGWFMMPLVKKLTNSLYDRTGLQYVTEIHFGDARIDDILTEEIMIVTYDFRNHTPVIFTREAAKKDPKMNVFIRDAA